MNTPTISVEIWSDVICPWCYIGKRRFESAAELLGDTVELDVVYRPYQLDPTASPGKTQPVFEAYSKKFGGPQQAQAILDRVTDAAAGEGIGFQMDRALRANTLLAHRLLWWAEQPDTPVDQTTLKERLLQAYFVDGLNIGDPDVLAECAADVGADADAALRFLESDAGRSEVSEFLDQANDHGITAVPTFVINGQWAIPGAQDAETFVNVIERLVSKMVTEPGAVDGADAACTDDACDV